MLPLRLPLSMSLGEIDSVVSSCYIADDGSVAQR